MGKKLITDEGKTELLRLAFKREEAGGSFCFLALGGTGSEGAQGKLFKEVSGDNYSRVQTEVNDDQIKDKTITITGTFEEQNYAPTDNTGDIKEIGLCNSDTNTDNQIFFMYSEVPTIRKTGDISLQYTIVISID